MEDCRLLALSASLAGSSHVGVDRLLLAVSAGLPGSIHGGMCLHTHADPPSDTNWRLIYQTLSDTQSSRPVLTGRLWQWTAFTYFSNHDHCRVNQGRNFGLKSGGSKIFASQHVWIDVSVLYSGTSGRLLYIEAFYTFYCLLSFCCLQEVFSGFVTKIWFGIWTMSKIAFRF